MHQVGPAPCAAPAIPAAVSLLSRQLAALARFDDLAHQESGLELILHEACRSAAEGVDVRFAGVLQYRADEHAFVLQAGVGVQARLVGRARIAANLETTAGLAWHTNQPIHFRHLVAGGRIQGPDAVTGQGVCRLVSVPVHGESKIAFGVLEVGSAEAGEFTQHDLLFLQALADSVAATVARYADRASRADRAALVAEGRRAVRDPQLDGGRPLHVLSEPDERRRTRSDVDGSEDAVVLNAAKRHQGLTFTGLQQDTQIRVGSA